MRAGALRDFITIQQRVDTQDSVGQPIPAWSTFLECYADVEPLNGREFFTARQLAAEVDIRVRLRYVPGVLPTMRLLIDDVYFDIQSIIDVDSMHRELVLMCKTGLVDQ